MLQDVTCRHLDGDRAEIFLGDTVATVQPNPLRLAAIEAARRAGECETKAARVHDAFVYTTPDGATYSHPSKAGALHMCRKWFVEAGLVLVPFDHSHMNPADRARAHDLARARAKITGPRCGDFVQIEGRGLQRICGFGFTDSSRFALTPGGSFSLPSDPAKLGPDWESYSGGLDWSPEYIRADLMDSGRYVMGRFWFFSGGRMAAGGGVDVALPCRVYRLKGDSA